MSKKRILFVVPALRRAGAESQLVTLINGLSDDEFELHLVSYRTGDDLVSDIDASKVNLHQLNRRNRFDIGVGREISRIIDKCKIDVVHCTLMNALVFGLLGRFIATRNPSAICVIHTTKNVSLKHDLADFLVHRQLLKKCQQVWFVSSRQSEQWIEKMPFLSGHQKVIHNGVDVTRFDPKLFESQGKEFRARLDIGADEMVICCVAGLRPEKLHEVLVNAVAILGRRGIACRLLLAGDGVMRKSLRMLVDELQLGDVVEFLGSVSDVRPVLAASDCKVLPSVAETFSMAMLESMAMGVPVVSTEVGGAREVIEDGVSGALVAPGDADALATRIGELIEDKALRRSMGMAARQTVVDSFRQETMIEKSADCLRDTRAS